MNISEKLFGLPENYSAHGGQVDHLMDVVHWFMIVLFVGWSLFFLYTIWRFWHRRSPKASYEGVRSHLSSHLEIGVIIVEAVLLLGFAFPLWAERVDTWADVQKLNPVRVRVVGWQFGWTHHYPGADGKFGRVDPDLISGANSIGIDYTDPNALDDFTSPILRLPVNRPAVLNVGSKDVIHGYAIKPMRIQQDAIPGKEIPMWFTPTRTMETYVICAQLCGEGHANMVGSLEVVAATEFQTWADGQTETALKGNLAAAQSTPTATEAAPEAATPEAATPEAATPEAATPEAATPGAATPEAATPEAATPEAATPEAATPEAATPEAATPEAATPEAATPEAAAPEAATPQEADPEEATPEEAAPEEADPASEEDPAAPADGTE